MTVRLAGLWGRGPEPQGTHTRVHARTRTLSPSPSLTLPRDKWPFLPPGGGGHTLVPLSASSRPLSGSPEPCGACHGTGQWSRARGGRMRGGPEGPGVRKAPWPVGAAERRASTWGKCLIPRPGTVRTARTSPGPKGSRHDVGQLGRRQTPGALVQWQPGVPATAHRAGGQARAGVPEPRRPALGPGACPSNPATPRLLPGAETPEKLWG